MNPSPQSVAPLRTPWRFALALGLGALLALSLSLPLLGHADNGPVHFQQLAEDPATASPRSPLKGSVASLRVMRGRSQIIKFAQPIARISIAEPTLADLIPLSPDQILINGKQRGVTSLVVWDENGQEGMFDLFVQNDSSELLQTIQAIAPNEKLDARVTDDSLILSGKVSDSTILDEIRKVASAYGYRDENFVDLTDTPNPQVYLAVKIAEANRSTIRDLKTSFSTLGGVTISRLANAADLTRLGITGTAGLIPQNVRRFDTTLNRMVTVAETLPNVQASSNVGGVTGTLFRNKNTFNAAFDLLETRGKITTLAEPTLVCTHGRTADFLAGGEFPYVSGTDQNGSPILSFREYGIKLKFTPWISMRSGRIEMKVEPEVSGLDRSNCVSGSGGSPVCGLLQRRTSTTVELQDGESLMISGILTQEEQSTFQQLPFIGNIPVLGNFFKNSAVSKSQRDLILVVTPHIVRADEPGTNLPRGR